MPKLRLFDGPVGDFIRKYKLIRRLAFVAAIIVAIYFLGAQNGWWRAKSPDPVSFSEAPTGELLASVYPVRSILRKSDPTLTGQDTKKLATVFRAFANGIEGDTEGLVASTSAVARAHSRAGRLFFGGSLQGKYPGLGDAVDSAIASHVGSGDIPLTEPKRREVVEVFRALSWAAGGK